jgi:hypothetical protein
MTDEYEFYHGSLLRSLIVECGMPIEVTADDKLGRVDSFAINRQVAVHIKHSEKRMSPWQFTFSRDNVEELIHLDDKYSSLFICFVCGDDGFLCITPEEFLSVTGPAKSDTYWLRISRPRNKMYEVTGNDGTLESKKARGISQVVDAIKAFAIQRSE